MTYDKTKIKVACHPRAGGDLVLLPKNYRPQITTKAKFESLRTQVLLLSLWSLVFGLWSLAAFAANYDIKEMTPEVREALAGRQSRHSALQVAKQSGAITENSEGLVSGSSELVNAENNDRLVIYQTIADQNELGAGGLAQIKAAFAETIRERDGR